MKNDPTDFENADVLKRINKQYTKLSRQHKIIADFIVGNLEKASYMTIDVLAATTNTSVATVLRLANLLGYDKYPEFRNALKNSSKSTLTTLQRIDMPGFEQYSIEAVREVLRHDMQNIKDTVEEINAEVFEDVIDKLIAAENIYLIGSRTSAFLVDYFAYYLNLLYGGKVHLTHDNFKDPFEQLLHLSSKDAVLGLSFPRYSTQTVKYLAYAKSKCSQVIGITDLPSSPIYPLCDLVLFAKSNIISFVDTLIAPLSLLNALIIGIGLKDKEHTREVFSELEELWSRNDTYND